MGRIDVTELMSDPDFVDTITMIDRTAATNSLGANTITECSRPMVGSVQPASGRAVSRLPEELRVANVMSFWVKGKLAAGAAKGKYPAILVFGGSRFQVQFVFDWTNWGAGWSEGTCVAESQV